MGVMGDGGVWSPRDMSAGSSKSTVRLLAADTAASLQPSPSYLTSSSSRGGDEREGSCSALRALYVRKRRARGVVVTDAASGAGDSWAARLVDTGDARWVWEVGGGEGGAEWYSGNLSEVAGAATEEEPRRAVDESANAGASLV